MTRGKREKKVNDVYNTHKENYPKINLKSFSNDFAPKIKKIGFYCLFYAFVSPSGNMDG